MIGYLEGNLLKTEEERILLLVNHVGYEVLLPSNVMAQLSEKRTGDTVALYIYYQQTERQPRPVLIGFTQESDKDFFQQFISVEDIGPMKAVKALDRPVTEIAEAIETGNLAELVKLKGIGKRTAQKIVASLTGKMGKFFEPTAHHKIPASVNEEIFEQVLDVMVNQLGHKVSEARQLVADALERNPDVSTPEDLFDEVYRSTGTQ